MQGRPGQAPLHPVHPLAREVPVDLHAEPWHGGGHSDQEGRSPISLSTSAMLWTSFRVGSCSTSRHVMSRNIPPRSAHLLAVEVVDDDGGAQLGPVEGVVQVLPHPVPCQSAPAARLTHPSSWAETLKHCNRLGKTS